MIRTKDLGCECEIGYNEEYSGTIYGKNCSCKGSGKLASVNFKTMRFHVEEMVDAEDYFD